MPLNTNGTATTTHTSSTVMAPRNVQCVLTGIRSWITEQTAIDTPNRSENRASWRFTSATPNRLGIRYTINAPPVMPNSAIEIATNAKWYHIVTLKIRVSPISYISDDNVTTNNPA